MRRVLLLIPVLIVLAAVGVWAWQLLAKKTERGPAPPEVHVKTETAAGITFEVEHELKEGVNLLTTKGADAIGFHRHGDLLDFEDGVMVLNGIGFVGPKPGDVVRWNLDGSLLVNGVPQQPHPIQPRPLEKPGTDLRWEPRTPSAMSRDTLSVDWPRTGRVLVAAHGDSVVRVWDADSGTVKQSLYHEPPKQGGRGAWGVRATISPEGKTIASANLHAPDVILWDAANGNKLATLSRPEGNVRAVQFLSDEWLLEVRGDKLLARRLTGDRSRTIELGPVPDQFEVPFAVSGDAKTLVRQEGTKATVYRIARGPDTLTLSATGAVIDNLSSGSILALSHDGGSLAVFSGSARPNRLLTVYDAATGAVTHRLRWRNDPRGLNQVTAMCFFPDGKTLAVGDVYGLRFYDLQSSRERGWIATPWVRSLAISADGKTLAAGLRYQSGLRLWDIAELK